MSSKKPKAVSDVDAEADVDKLFDGLETDRSKAKKPAKNKKQAPAGSGSDAHILADLADLENEINDPGQTSSSRPHTPRVGGAPPAGKAPSPAPVAAARKSAESARSLRTSFTPSATSSEVHEPERKGSAGDDAASAAQDGGAGGGWWGGLLSTATAAMRQAEAAVKEMQQNEEARKWADQVRGNVGALRGLGDELRQRAMPTFANILHTLAPPISSHERLLVHITHDFVGYPSLDPMIHSIFERVMSQVEGGDLLVIQRGQESSGHAARAGWNDGPWWRQTGPPRELGLVKGLAEGTKLCRAGAESYAREYFAAHGGLDQARLRATEALSESNPVRTSDLFLSVQAIGTGDDDVLFALTSAAEKDKETSAVQDQDEPDEQVVFAVFILDPIHELEFYTVSQAVPAKWVRWLDAPGPLTPASGGDDDAGDGDGDGDGDEDAGDDGSLGLPDEIREMVENGGLDPREWVAEWLEEVISLAAGVVAQRYVARRMGVGEGGLPSKGKMRTEEIIGNNAGEAARAGLI